MGNFHQYFTWEKNEVTLILHFAREKITWFLFSYFQSIFDMREKLWKWSNVVSWILVLLGVVEIKAQTVFISLCCLLFKLNISFERKWKWSNVVLLCSWKQGMFSLTFFCYNHSVWPCIKSVMKYRVWSQDKFGWNSGKCPELFWTSFAAAIVLLCKIPEVIWEIQNFS